MSNRHTVYHLIKARRRLEEAAHYAGAAEEMGCLGPIMDVLHAVKTIEMSARADLVLCDEEMACRLARAGSDDVAALEALDAAATVVAEAPLALALLADTVIPPPPTTISVDISHPAAQALFDGLRAEADPLVALMERHGVSARFLDLLEQAKGPEGVAGFLAFLEAEDDADAD